MSVKMNSSRPVQKITIPALSGAAVAVMLFFLKLDIPPGIESAMTVIFTFVLGYIVPPGKNEQVITEPKSK